MARSYKKREAEVLYDYVHGVGWEALLSCVILQAIRDAANGDAEAEAWLQSDGCDEILDYLDLPGVHVLNRVRRQADLRRVPFARRGDGKQARVIKKNRLEPI